ncbi:ankyrin repeat-containing domain protein [Lasiosphaeria miniovina]|uniref:Ankyrin repeat-containing domain protein n=1 Tax=Lasiosphaeria miniovina TaxID=1954250 RepID=A0AA40AWV3_9PEZI|nr:ankyrin repeat-containing domain protein [Lasiosphaeria miniovina]KAK0723478.1 ankyrin repeat-containing domain protein [Lasiosphaeria miniovina]
MTGRQDLAEFAVDEVGAQRLLATTCLRYIAHYLRSAKRTGSAQDLETFRFLRYSCRFWMDHARRWVELSQGHEAPGVLTDLIASVLRDETVVRAWTAGLDSKDTNTIPFMGPDGSLLKSPLHLAVSIGITEVVTRLLSTGADASATGSDGVPPLHAAIRREDMGMVQILLEHEASTVAADQKGSVPLLEAAGSGNVKLTALLYNHTDPSDITKHHSLPDGTRISILHRLAATATGPIFRIFLQPASKSGTSAIDLPALLDAQDEELSATPLHHAVMFDNIPVASLLLQGGARVDAQDKNDNTALHLAALSNNTRAWDLLIDHGASLTVKNTQGFTALAATWDRRRLDWDSYEENVVLSRGMQVNTRVLTKKADSPESDTPRHIFEKCYPLSKISQKDVKAFKKALGRENAIFQRLSHPYIVSYLGCKELEKEMPRLYLEYCDGGDLRNDVVSPSSTTVAPNPLFVPPLGVYPTIAYGEYEDIFGQPGLGEEDEEEEGACEVKKWSEIQLWRMIYQLYSALAHLHYGITVSADAEDCVYEPSWDPVIHRDINPKNVVLSSRPDGQWDAKLCDLGIARDAIKDNMSLARGRGTIGYQPPEVEKGQQWSPKGDVWALASEFTSFSNFSFFVFHKKQRPSLPIKAQLPPAYLREC